MTERNEHQGIETERGSTAEVPSDATWYKVAEPGELAEGRVRTAVAGPRTIALTHCGGRFGALENHCPHQGGPLGEGSIENGLLRCPWHGYDYDPITGRPPAGFSDAPEAFPVEVRDDGVYVAVSPLPDHRRDVSDVMVETMVAWGSPRLRHGRAFEPGVRRRHASGRAAPGS